MPLTRPIPRVALPVVKILRRDVNRPSCLPDLEKTRIGRALRWKILKNPKLLTYCCPMGMHPSAKSSYPVEFRTFPVKTASDSSVLAFANWWDEQEDAVAAVNAIWGSK